MLKLQYPKKIGLTGSFFVCLLSPYSKLFSFIIESHLHPLP